MSTAQPSLTYSRDIEPRLATSYDGREFMADREAWAGTRYYSETYGTTWLDIGHDLFGGVGTRRLATVGSWTSIEDAADADDPPPAWLVEAWRQMLTTDKEI